MKINIPIDWIMGHLRYGHLEGEVNFTTEEENEFKSLLLAYRNEVPLTEDEEEKLEDYKEWVRDSCSIVIDDYEIDDYGDIEWGYLIEE